jgi:outer membrane murein-binding lipoprotein Lpp
VVKNKLFFGMIVYAALAIGVILAGCANGANGDDPGIENTD